MTETDRAWLAAFVVGEGNISLRVPSTKRGRSSPRALAPIIQATNTDFETIFECSRILKDAGIKHFVTSPHDPGNGRRSFIQLMITKKAAVLKALRFMHPYLIGKKLLQADLLIQFLERACAAKKYIPDGADYVLAFQIMKLKDRSRGERLHKIHGEYAELTSELDPKTCNDHTRSSDDMV